MDLEEILVKDREAFETKVAAETDPTAQYTAGMDLFNEFITNVNTSKSSARYFTIRIDAFMAQCVKHKVVAGIVMHVLRATVGSADNYLHRYELGEYYKSLTMAPTPLASPAVARPLPEQSEYLTRRQQLIEKIRGDNRIGSRPSLTKLIELQRLCLEYQEWLDEVQDHSVGMDPKNYPTKDQLRIRDSIRQKISDLATPDLLLSMSIQALANGDFSE